MAKKERTAKQKAADAKRSREMKGRNPFGNKGKRSKRSPAAKAASSKKKGKWTVKKVAKVAAVGAVLIVTGKDVANRYHQGRKAGWGEIDSAVYGATGVRQMTGQIAAVIRNDKTWTGKRIDADIAAIRIGEAIAFVGAPKAIDKLASKLPADIKSAKVPLVGMPLVTP